MKTKGEATIIGYVLLIVLALALAGAVYGFLRFYIPKDKPTCPDGIGLIVGGVSCKDSWINLTLVNRGLFTVDGAHIKMGVAGRSLKKIINCPSEACETLFTQIAGTSSLKPGMSLNRIYLNPDAESGKEYEIEIDPIVLGSENTTQILCSRAIVYQQVRCEG